MTPHTGEPDVLTRAVPWWRIGWLACIVVTGGGALVIDGLETTSRLAISALLAVLTAATLTVGRHLLEARQNDRPVGTPLVAGYLVAVCAISLAISALLDLGSLLYFIAYSQIWMMSALRPSIIASLGLTTAIVGINVAQAGWTVNAVVAGGLIGFVGIGGIGILMGWWITRIIEESEERRRLLAELARTRDQLGEAKRRAGGLAERQRLAAEIHDTLAQGFSSVLIQVRATDPDDPDDLARRLARIERTAEDNLAEARALIEAAQPTELRDRTLADACRRVTERFADTSGTPAEFEVDGTPGTLSPNAEVVLLRAVQEALTNVGKHAAASTVEVRLSYRERDVEVRIADDGRGFDHADEADDAGHGLSGMRGRAEQVGGAVRIGGGPGAGTAVTVRVPR